MFWVRRKIYAAAIQLYSMCLYTVKQYIPKVCLWLFKWIFILYNIVLFPCNKA